MKIQTDEDLLVLKEIQDKMDDVRYEVGLRMARYENDRNFYNGDKNTFWGSMTVNGVTKAPGKFTSVFNYPKVIVDKYAAMLSAPIYDFECPPSDPSEEESNASDLREKAIRKVLDDNDWETVFRKGATCGSLFGDTFFKIYLRDKDIIIKNIDIPDNVYLGYKSNDYDDIEWIAYKYRITEKQARKLYNIPPEQNIQGDQNDISGIESKSQTMIECVDFWDEDKNVILINNYVAVNQKNEYGFVPYIHVPNTCTPGTPYGTNDIDIVKNAIVDYIFNLCDQGDLLNAFVNPKIKAKNMPRVPASWFNRSSNTNSQVFGLRKDQDLDYLQWGGNIWPMKEHLAELLNNIYRLSCLPPVAFGEQIGSVITGYGLSVQYHSTVQKIIAKRSNWERGLRKLHSYILHLTEIIEKDADVFIKKQYDSKIIWPEVLPKDSNTHVLNTINKYQAGFISLDTAMKDIGVQSTVDEKSMLMTEKTDERLNPDKATQYINAQMQLMQLMQQMKQMQQQEQMEQQGMTPDGQSIEGQPQEGQPNGTPEAQGQAQPALAPEQNQAGEAGLPMTQAGMAGNMAETAPVEGSTIKSPNLNKVI